MAEGITVGLIDRINVQDDSKLRPSNDPRKKERNRDF
jgi:hypothetical protein